MPTLRYLVYNVTFVLDSNGLIFYNSEKPGRTSDFLSLQLLKGVPELTLETGNGPETLKGDRPLVLNKWHTIRLMKIDSRGNIEYLIYP